MEYREELKFICSDYDFELLGHRLRTILPYDSHQKGDCYTIRSLYFDTYDDACFYENAAGLDNRKKFRIRTYNNSDQKIQFEIKEKLHGKTKKSSCPLTRSACDAFIRGKFSPYVGQDSMVLNQVIREQKLALLHPAVIVEYERTAFVYRAGNVRITFDRNISASPNLSDFFDKDLLKYPVMPPGWHVLEIKYDELIPDFIAQTLEIGSLRRSAYSKYYLCRQICDTAEKLIF